MSIEEARRLGLSLKAVQILARIPHEGWKTSRQISKETGFNPRVVGATISSVLLHKHVSRQMTDTGEGYEYQRRSVALAQQ